jgi:hypothetical protein
VFATRPELVGELRARAHERGIRAAFATGDKEYGGRAGRTPGARSIPAAPGRRLEYGAANSRHAGGRPPLPASHAGCGRSGSQADHPALVMSGG